MIKSFKDKNTKNLFNRQPVHQWNSIQAIARNKLEALNAATQLTQLSAVPGNRLRKLSGDLRGYYRLWVNKQYRIIFQWKDNHAYQVQLLDYH